MNSPLSMSVVGLGLAAAARPRVKLVAAPEFHPEPSAGVSEESSGEVEFLGLPGDSPNGARQQFQDHVH